MAVTLKDIAGKVGVSYSTVSRAVNQETAGLVNERTRERVLRAAAKYGYIPHRHTRTLKLSIKQTRVVGFAYSWPKDSAQGEFVDRVLNGVYEGCEMNHCDVEVFPVRNGHAGEVSRQIFSSRLLDGILIFDDGENPRFFDQLFSSEDIPRILIRRSEPSRLEQNCVYVSSRKAGQRAATHLIAQGRRRIVVIAGPSEWYETKPFTQGVQDALSSHGRRADAKYVFRIPSIKEDGRETGTEALYLGASVSDAVICSHDRIALRLIRLCQERGIRVPEDIAIVGSGDTEHAGFSTPMLTSVRYPADEIGRIAAWMFYDRVSKKQSMPVQVEVPVELAIRDSSLPVFSRPESACVREDALV